MISVTALPRHLEDIAKLEAKTEPLSELEQRRLAKLRREVAEAGGMAALGILTPADIFVELVELS